MVKKQVGKLRGLRLGFPSKISLVLMKDKKKLAFKAVGSALLLPLIFGQWICLAFWGVWLILEIKFEG